MRSTQASAKHKQHARLGGDAQCGTTLLAGGRQHGRPHRVADDLDARCGAEFAFELCLRDGIGKGEHGSVLGKRLVGHARHGILLMEHQRDPGLCGSRGKGEAHVRPEAHSCGRLAVARELGEQGLAGTLHLDQGRDGRPGARPVEAADVEALEREALLRHKRGLHALLRAVKAHLVAAVAQLMGKRQRRVDMTGGAAGRNGKHAHRLLPSWRLDRSAASDPRDCLACSRAS